MEQKPCEQGKQREFWLDLARGIAIFSVTLNHALSRSFSTYEGTQAEFLEMSPAGSFLKALLCVFSRLGVPLFLMISGALLLKRDYGERKTLRRILTHNWWELLRTTEIWLLIMFWLLQALPGSVLRAQGMGRALVSCAATLLFCNQTTMPSMWYMPMILMLYLMIPVMALAVQKLGDRYFFVLFAAAFVCGMGVRNINTLLYAAGINAEIEFAFSVTDLFSMYFLYILAGDWISRGKLSGIGTPWIAAGFVLSLTGTAVFQFWIYSTPADYYVQYADCGVLFAGAFLFEWIRRRPRVRRAVEKPVRYISGIAFGIYFLHICVMTGLVSLFEDVFFGRRFPGLIALEGLSLLISVLVIRITSKSGRIRRYVYLIK